ncbi:MAG: hypothetical protein L0216_15120 [Planctomycetales bacterium]|nr:hypothetical protein [Planctomycetales bacterium]
MTLGACDATGNRTVRVDGVFHDTFGDVKYTMNMTTSIPCSQGSHAAIATVTNAPCLTHNPDGSWTSSGTARLTFSLLISNTSGVIPGNASFPSLTASWTVTNATAHIGFLNHESGG